MIRGGALALSLWGMGLCLSMASILDGVMEITVVADPVVRMRTSRRKVMLLLLPRLGTLGPWPVRAIDGGVSAAFSCRWGMSISAVPVGIGHNLGRPRENDTALGGQTLSVLLEGDVEERLRLVQPLVALQVWCFGGVF